MDGRRRRYVPLDIYVAHKRFGVALLAKFGIEGLGVWAALLAAAKRGVHEGQFCFVTEDEAWAGLTSGVRPSFGLDEFLRFTGEWKKTSRRRSGALNILSISRWEAWNKAWNSQLEAEQKARKRGTNAPTIQRHYADDTPTEVKRSELLAEVTQIGGKRPEQLLWDALAAALDREANWNPTKGERGRMNKAIKELLEVEATPQEVQLRAGKWGQRYPNAELTPQALTNHWSSLGPTALEREEQRRNQEFLAQMHAARNGHEERIGQ